MIETVTNLLEATSALRSHLSTGLLVLLAISFVMLCLQAVTVARHLREPLPPLRLRPPISILKPLCGIDDDLVANLRLFATLDYPDYEVVMGVRSTNDAAYPVALQAAAQWPDRMRVVIQRGEPGLNPKVNQLITLTDAARHALLVVSDSNVRVGADYLDEIAINMTQPGVGMMSHPVIGVDEQRSGSRMDNLHLTSWVGTGMISAARILRQDVVVGKSMAIWRRDLRALGGFESMKDVLGEDYVLGNRVATELKKRIVIGRTPVMNVSRDRSISDFYARYQRWSVMHRQAVGRTTYMVELLLSPILLALLAFAVSPSLRAVQIVCLATLFKIGFESISALTMRGTPFSLRTLALIPAKDLILGYAWLYGLLHNEVNWRGNKLRVLPGTLLAPSSDAEQPRRERLYTPMRIIRRVRRLRAAVF